MDKTEQLADMVVMACQALLEKKLAPLVEGLATLRREWDAREFVTKDENLKLLAGLESLLREEIKTEVKTQAPAISLDRVKLEAGAAALDACTRLLESIPKPADGKSVTMAEVLPEVQKLVAEIPRPKDGANADPQEVAAEVARQIALVPPPQDGKSVDLGAIFTEIGGAVSRAVAALPPPEPGKSVTLDDVRPLIQKGIADAVAEIPRPEDGKSVTLEDVRPLIDQGIAEAVAEIPIPEDGKSVTLEDVKPLIDEAVAAIPIPKDGASVTLEDVRPMLAEMVAAIPPPVNGKDADLVLVNDLVTMAVKAAMAEFRPPEKGDPGKDADPVDMDELRRHLTAEVTRELGTWERPKDGENGLGFDDMTMSLKEDGRTLVFRFARGEREKVFEIICPWQMYCGVYEKGQSYQKGDQVTFGGSQFTAKRDTTKSPETGDWTLSVKRGKDAA